MPQIPQLSVDKQIVLKGEITLLAEKFRNIVFEGLSYRYACLYVHLCAGVRCLYTHACMLYVCMCVYVCLFVLVFVCVFLHQVFVVNRDKDQSKGACWMKRALRPN